MLYKYWFRFCTLLRLVVSLQCKYSAKTGQYLYSIFPVSNKINVGKPHLGWALLQSDACTVKRALLAGVNEKCCMIERRPTPILIPPWEHSKNTISFSCLTTPLIKVKPLLDELSSSSPTRQLMYVHNTLVTAA